MTEPEWQIAKVTYAFLGYEDHGFLTIMLTLNYGGSGQGAGGYALGIRGKGDSDDAAQTLRYQVQGILDACGVDEWNKVAGRTIMALADHGKVHAIKPLPTENGKEFWFDMKAKQSA